MLNNKNTKKYSIFIQYLVLWSNFKHFLLTEHVDVKEAVTEAVVVEEPKAEESNKVTIRIDLLYNLQWLLCQIMPVIGYLILCKSEKNFTIVIFFAVITHLRKFFPHFSFSAKRFYNF